MCASSTKHVCHPDIEQKIFTCCRDSRNIDRLLCIAKGSSVEVEQLGDYMYLNCLNFVYDISFI